MKRPLKRHQIIGYSVLVAMAIGVVLSLLTEEQERQPRQLLPALIKGSDKLISITLVDRQGEVMIDAIRTDSGWRDGGEQGAKVDAQKLAELIRVLGRTVITEAITSLEENYPKYGVDYPGKGERSARTITIKAEGDWLKHVWVGDIDALNGGNYLRYSDEEISVFRVDKVIPFPDTRQAWLLAE